MRTALPILALLTLLALILGLGQGLNRGSIGALERRTAPEHLTTAMPTSVIDEQDRVAFAQKKEEELLYLLSLQDTNGIIAQTPDHMLSIPYFSNLAATAMLSDPRGLVPVRHYMNWYIGHLNRPDKYGVLGTMYDWKQVNGEWVPTYSYDSADSYAATFLTLALRYTQVTGDVAWAQSNVQALVDIARVLIQLQDIDGLIWAKPRYYVKFLMDNAENYRGLRDAALLMRYLGRDDLTLHYNTAAERVAAGMEERLWLPEEQVYAWALYGRWWARPPREKWYPDTVSQVYPVVFGVIDPDSERARNLYAYLNLRYPDWTKGQFDDPFSWTVISFMAALMQDEARVVEHLQRIHFGNTETNRAYPWHSFESAFFVKTWGKLKDR